MNKNDFILLGFEITTTFWDKQKINNQFFKHDVKITS